MSPSSNHTDLMPDTSGMNFYIADPDLAFLLERHLSQADNERAQRILTDMGAVASEHMDTLAELANRQGPTLVQFDKRGQRIDAVVFHPAYHELERIAKAHWAGLVVYHSPSNSLSATSVCRLSPASSVPSP